MSKVTLKGYILVPANKLKIIKKELEIHKKLTLNEDGCITFNVKQNKEEPTKFDVYEEFIDKVAFNNHQKRIRSSKWGDVTKNVKRFYEIFE